MLAGFGPWTWLTLGAALLVIEVITPGTFVLWWLGISAVLVGLLSLVIDLAWQVELIAFALLTLVTALAWLRLGRRQRLRSIGRSSTAAPRRSLDGCSPSRRRSPTAAAPCESMIR